MISKHLYALQFKTHQSFEYNLNHFIALASRTPEGSIILAPEVALTNFCYQRMEEAHEFGRKATDTFLKISSHRTIILTLIEKQRQGFYNNLKVFHQGELIHKQSKSKLFPLGGEHFHFKEGSEGEILPFKIDGISCGAINCFELRFTHLWNRLRGVDIIFVPAQWALQRKHHFKNLGMALAISNQCFVVLSNGANEKMAKSSAIISPFGEILAKDNDAELIGKEVDLEEVKEVRQHINVGLSSE
ncbi:carbon-nitrogen hydrolase family protein [Helicobacter monodelphidis]|uniref:carbon-nitrogen hydrolase family protein n=1 Tax=Helicobacter sp. 15-1451 TaxID=2004995 RepID=UPI0015EC5940|nr:carbon-nitrogen hydrolase family protein [Helicobacter sp. 15-1451]